MRALKATSLLGLGLLICGAAAVSAGSGEPDFRSAGARQVTVLDGLCPASDFPPIEIFFASGIRDTPPGTKTNIRCQIEAKSNSVPVKGVPVMLGGDLVDGDGDLIAPLPARSGRTNRAGQKVFSFPFSVPPPGSELGVIMEGALSGNDQIDALDTTCSVIQRTPCRNSSFSACMGQNKRFKVEVDARTSSGPIPGMVLKSNRRESLFYFFSPGSSDLLVQLLNRCSSNDHFWVFATSSTSVPFDLTVTDTFSGESRAYENPGLEPIVDTSAFATCP